MYNIVTEKQKIASAIRNQCKQQGISLSTLAEMSGVSKSTLSMIMNGKSLPYLHTLYQICNALEVSVGDILDGEGSVDSEEGILEIDEDEKHILDVYRGASKKNRNWLLQAVDMLEKEN